MALTCTLPGLVAVVPGSLNNLSSKQKLGLRILYLYRQKNPATVGQDLPATTLLSQAACLECGVSESMLQAFEVWIQRQAAIDAGAALAGFDTAGALNITRCLQCFSMGEMRAIEVMLKCQLS